LAFLCALGRGFKLLNSFAMMTPFIVLLLQQRRDEEAS
jgi:hypothetical protein